MTDFRSRSLRVAQRLMAKGSPVELRRGLVLGAVAVLAGVGGVACAPQPMAVSGAPQAAAAPGVPVAVNCGPGHQALIRPSLVNGQAISQVDCVATTGTTMTPSAGVAPQAAAVAYPIAAPQPAMSDDVETMAVERPVYRQAARPASYRTAEYVPERRVVKSGRSWKKSALIIGSSAGIGAGVGGAAGGKKGALIGAAIGGGGATIWDQITRR